MLKLEVKKRLKKSLWVLVGASLASLVTMLLIQFAYGEALDFTLNLRKALMLGFSMAIIVILMPDNRAERYPWQ